MKSSITEQDKSHYYHLPSIPPISKLKPSHRTGNIRIPSPQTNIFSPPQSSTSTNSILLGYDIGVMSGAVLYIKDDLNISSIQVEILVGCLKVCSLIGSLAAGRTSDCIGRRYTIVLAAVTFLIGAILMGLAPSFSFLMAGRVFTGIGVGFALMIGPVYTAELSPALTRGYEEDEVSQTYVK